MKVVRTRLAPYRVDLPAAATESGRTQLVARYGWWLQVETAAGILGVGDAACFGGFGSGVAATRTALDQLGEQLAGRTVESVQDIELALAPVGSPEARHAGELALLDALSRARGQSLREIFAADASPANSVLSHALVGLAGEPPPANAAGRYKVKVGAVAASDSAAALRPLCERLPVGARLRVDVGGAWTFQDAEAALPALAELPIEWIEEPVAGGADELASLSVQARLLGMRLAADESADSADAIRALCDARAVDVIVLKPMFLGGLLPALAAARAAHNAGLAVCVTHALESAVGRLGARHLAAAVPGVHGIGGAVPGLPAAKDGIARLPTGPGLGLTWADIADRHRAAPPVTEDAIPLPLQSSAIARPHHPALEYDGRVVTYAELADSAARKAATLRARGHRTTDRIVLEGAAGDPLAFAAAVHAVGWLGATAHIPSPKSAEASPLPNAGRVDPSALPAADAPLPERAWPEREPRFLLFTSGTTGTPRRAELTTRQLLYSSFGSAVRLGHDPADRWLCCLPLHHIGGLSILFRCAVYGTTAVMHPNFDAAAVNRAIDSGRVTMVSLVPTMLARVLDDRGDAPFPSTLRCLLIGGAGTSADLRQRCRRTGAPVAFTWGMTEAASQIATTFVGEPSDRSSDAGPPLPFCRVGGKDPLTVHGPTASGSLVTADRGDIEGGRVRVLGRVDRTIVSGGENIDAAEIEHALCTHPAIEEALVVPLADAEWGHRPGAVVVPVGEDRPSLDDLHSFLSAHLPRFKAPDHLVWVDTLPLTGTGKPSLPRAVSLFSSEVSKATEETTP